jgi:HK97 family phage portal protein
LADASPYSSNWATDPTSAFLGTRTASGKRVNPTSALRLAAVHFCASLIADSISTLPVLTYRQDGPVLRLTSPPRWLRQPCLSLSPEDFWHRVIVSLLLDGNGYIQVFRNSAGAVAELRPVHPSRVAVWRDTTWGHALYSIDGVRTRHVGAPPLADMTDAAYPATDAFEILHIPAFTIPDALTGMSVIDAAREAIGAGLTVEEFGARFFDQGTSMSGIIEHPSKATADEIDLIRNSFKRRHAGVRNSHAIGVLTGGATWKPISITPEQAQFLDTRRFNKVDVALFFRVPPWMVDPQVSSTWGSGIEEMNWIFIQNTLVPWMTRIEGHISTFLLPGLQRMRFDVDSRLRAKTHDRYMGYKFAIENGWMNKDEVRAKEGLAPIPNGLGQVYVQPLNLAPLGSNPVPDNEVSADMIPGADTDNDGQPDNPDADTGSPGEGPDTSP